MSDFKAKMHQIRFFAGAPPQTPLEELIALLRAPAVFERRRDRGQKEREEKVKGREDEVEGDLTHPKILA